MKPYTALLVPLGLIVAGCSPPAKIATGRNDEEARQVDVQIPAQYEDRGIALVRNERRIRAGDSVRDAFDAFPRPRGGYEVSERPPFLSELFSGRGWEASAETFSVIEKGGRIVLALYTLENGDRERTDDILMAHARALPSSAMTVVPGNRADYWFWEAGGQRAMVCRATDARHRKVVAAAVGDARIMDLYRMDPASAREDQAKLEAIFKKTRSGP